MPVLPGYHLGSIQGLGLSDDADGLFRVVELVQVDPDGAVPLLRVLVRHRSFFVSVGTLMFRQTFREKMRITFGTLLYWW